MIFYETHGDLYLLEQLFKNKYGETEYQFFSQDVELRDVQFIIGQYSSMSRGVDLKDLRNIVFFAPTDKWKDLEQARYRIKRSKSY